MTLRHESPLRNTLSPSIRPCWSASGHSHVGSGKRIQWQKDSSGAEGELPGRSEVADEDKWDLSQLFANEEDWQKALEDWKGRLPEYARFQGKLNDPETLSECLAFDIEVDRLSERVAVYAFLRCAEDVSDSRSQQMRGQVVALSSQTQQMASFLRPELLSYGEETLETLLNDSRLQPYRLMLERIVRYKPHTLSQNEERLLAMQGEMAQTASQVFSQLNNADLKFGKIEDDRGKTIELTHGSFSSLLHSPEREVRKKAFHQFYHQYQKHENTLSASLAGSIHRDIYYARAKNFESARDAALFGEHIPPIVYDNLLHTVHEHLPSLYRYFDLRRRKMELERLHHYDTYVPILSDIRTHHSWDEAVERVLESLAPLGDEYCKPLREGMKDGRWCDRFENRGKQSGAFSCPSYDGPPYILMNYKSDVLESVFTLAHEAGHSMHTYFSIHHQPYQYYDYVLFVAEVASTFNEQLLARHLFEKADDPRMQAYLINRQIDAMRGTIFRQTMFAEFEMIVHAAAEAGEPMTVESFRTHYHKLLGLYFGPDFALDEQLDLECFRIPHFYRAFYVYKYATGMSAAIALADRVLEGGKKERDEYLEFLAGGCSKEPLDLLRDAGVDMEKPAPIKAAMQRFSELVDRLEQLI
jgi:oligoendopeptidase F